MRSDQQHQGLMTFKCNRRGMPVSHTLGNDAYITIENGCAHGANLYCNHPLCKGKSFFKYCRVCRKPCNSRNFTKHHDSPDSHPNNQGTSWWGSNTSSSGEDEDDKASSSPASAKRIWMELSQDEVRMVKKKRQKEGETWTETETPGSASNLLNEVYEWQEPGIFDGFVLEEDELVCNVVGGNKNDIDFMNALFDSLEKPGAEDMHKDELFNVVGDKKDIDNVRNALFEGLDDAVLAEDEPCNDIIVGNNYDIDYNGQWDYTLSFDG